MKLRLLHPGTAIALFFGVLIAFNVAFYVIALSNPPDLLPTPAAASQASPAQPAAHPVDAANRPPTPR